MSLMLFNRAIKWLKSRWSELFRIRFDHRHPATDQLEAGYEGDNSALMDNEQWVVTVLSLILNSLSTINTPLSHDCLASHLATGR